MKIRSITLFGNPSSVHLKQWMSLLDKELPVRIWHAEVGVHPGAMAVERSFPQAARLPRVIRYAAAGIMARMLLHGDADTLVHGHNASGYGLMAALSGRPYLITVYGTEIYSMPERGAFYRWIMTRILNGALGISTSSQQMKVHLSRKYPRLANKVSHFSWGVDTEVFAPGAAERNADQQNGLPDFAGCERPVFFVNRRITPHYRTAELLDGFLAYKSAGGAGTLVLLKGDAFAGYFGDIQQKADGVAHVKIVRDHIGPRSMAALLAASDVFVSVPISDSLSSAVLEGMACGTFAVLSGIAAYAELGDAGAKPLLTNASSAGDFFRLFKEVSQIPAKERHKRAQASREVVLARYSVERARMAMHDFYARHLGGS
jgi:glycosyltransferase involved in cell wall biosynthesis